VVGRPLLIQGHRGARGLQPENTLPSFEAALDAGANSLEADVHLTADGVPVLIHDPQIAVLPRGSDAVWVHELTLAQICLLRIDPNARAQRFTDQRAEPSVLVNRLAWDWNGDSYRVPSLADLLILLAAYEGDQGRRAGKTDVQRANAAKAIIDLDIKRRPFRDAPKAGDLENAILEDTRKHRMVERTWVRSFDHRIVRRLRQIEPRLTGVVLIEGTAPVDPVAMVRAEDAQVYAPDYLYLDEERVRQCHAAGIRVMPWTVNDADDWNRLITWGVDGITTDYPDRLAAHLREK
jgi:glycerophosphoryl diester phosphodiesterase